MTTNRRIVTTECVLRLAKRTRHTLPFTRQQLDDLSMNGKWAIAYALLGLLVFPLVPGTKIPFEGSQGFYDATNDLCEIFEYWTIQPLANIGIRTGKEGGVFALDCDKRNGGVESCEELQEQNGDFPETPFNHTPGGFHLLFAYPDDGRVINSRPGNKAPMVGIDVKADKAYIVAPPSFRTDVCLAYEWNEWENPFETEFAAAPEWVLDIVAIQSPDDSQTSTPRTDWSLFSEPATEGLRHDALISIGGLFFRALDPDIAYPALHAWNKSFCSPPLADKEVDEISGWIAGKELERRRGWRAS